MKPHTPTWLALGLLAVASVGLYGQLKFQREFAAQASPETQDRDGQPTPPHAEPRGPVPKPDLLTAADPLDAGEALKKFFESKGFAGLADLQNDPDISLALQGGWERALWPGSDQVPPRPQRFLGFVEGRLGVKVPPRWEYDIVRHCLGNDPRDDRLVAATRAYLPLFDFLRDARDGDTLLEPKKLDQDLTQSAPGSTNMERKDGVVSFRVSQAEVRVREKALPVYAGGFTVCAAHLGPKRSFIAYHDNAGTRFPLLCVDSRSGEVLWKQTVWATGPLMMVLKGLFGQGQRDLAFVFTAKEVILFGNGWSGCFLEAFDEETGKPAYRFRTTWSPDDSTETEQWRRQLRQGR